MSNPAIVLEQSPPTLKDLLELLKDSPGIAIGAYAGLQAGGIYPPLLLLTVPTGMILGGAAFGIAMALRQGLAKRLEDYFDKSAASFREPDMVVIPGGTFWMGSSDSEEDRDSNESPRHEVTVPRFAMGRYTVTFDEYDAFCEATKRDKPNDYGWGRGNRPVIHVNWHDAIAYTEWLSKETGKRYRLPSESEWEYAARAGTTTHYWWGDDIGKNHANCMGSGSQWSGKQTAPVGSFEPNLFGLHDTAGNVLEWVQDCWHEDYRGAPVDGSARETPGDRRRVLRGGSWSTQPRHVRSANRNGYDTDDRSHRVGFRLAQDL